MTSPPDSSASPEPANSVASYALLRKRALLRLLRMHHEAGVGHIGGNLSALDALLVLHHRVMADDDVFILAKGHAAGALYIALWSRGEISDDELASFHADDSRLSGHPAPAAFAGIPVATGSLGHGLPVSAGIALARKLDAAPGRVFCLCSDGEWQEGSNWEALIFAAKHELESLVLVVDVNGLQGFGTTAEVGGIDNLSARFESFGFATSECDGHDAEAIAAELGRDAPGPRAVLLRTVKGKGISFMENELAWHYMPLDDAQFAKACAEVERG